MSDELELQIIEDDGYEDGFANLPYHNPYPMLADEWFAWERGYWDGVDDE